MAFYFPQFHTVPQNVREGKFYNDWDLLKESGRDRPLTPMKYYDGSSERTLQEHDDLADKYGIGGFIFYHYWRDNQMMMHLPLDLFVQSERKTKMILCWDNQNTRYNEPTKHAYELLRFFKNENYLRELDGSVPFLIYRTDLVEKTYLLQFRKFLSSFGVNVRILTALQGLYIAQTSVPEWADGGFEFAPNLHGFAYESKILNPKTSVHWQGVLVGWDSRPRQLLKSSRHFSKRPKKDGMIDVKLFEKALQRTRHSIRSNNQDKVITLFAWNEWSEGGVLECSQEFGCSFLDVIGETSPMCKSSRRMTTKKGVDAFPVLAAPRENECSVVFSKYVPSMLEKQWIDHIDDWQDLGREWTKGCIQARKDRSRLEKWVSDLRQPGSQMDQGIFSRLEFADSCSKDIKVVFVEPLAVFLRHPITRPCFDVDNLLNKDYLLPLDESLPTWKQEAKVKSRDAFYFDLGCSQYTSGEGGPSLQWFVDSYKKNGITFSRIFGWEATRLDPVKFWSDVPLEIQTIMTLINVPVESGKNSKFNPLNFIRQLAKPNDFVLLKLDIDNNKLENEFIQQILEDVGLQKLIDEIYWENHVIGNPVAHMGAWVVPLPLPTSFLTDVNAYQNLSASYDLFFRLRSAGIVAHSWV